MLKAWGFEMLQQNPRLIYMLTLILLVFAFVLFVLAGIGIPNPPGRWNFIGLGLACWTLAEILKGVPAIH